MRGLHKRVRVLFFLYIPGRMTPSHAIGFLYYLAVHFKSQGSSRISRLSIHTIDALIKASYEVVSGEKGAKRQWERDNNLHHSKAVYSYYDREDQKQATMTL